MSAIHDFAAKLLQPEVRPQLDAYVAWRRELARALEAGEVRPAPPEIAPISINLDLTTACNYRCDHCIDWDILNTKHKYLEDELRESLVTMRERGLRSVILIGGGEPTLYRGFSGFVGFLKEIGLQVAVVSNGSRGERLLEAARHMDEGDWIRLSLDSGSNELFRAMHRPVDPELDLDAICSWVPKIKAVNPLPRVGYSFIIVWRGSQREEVELCENIHEIVMASERAKAAGFDYISLKPVLERGPDGAEVLRAGDLDATESAQEGQEEQGEQAEHERVLARIRGEIERARVLGDEGFSVHESINLRVLEDGSWREYTRQPQTCHMQAFRQVLTPLGLYNCPAHRGVDKARIAGRDAYRDAGTAARTAGMLDGVMQRFDAHAECAEVTCLYNPVNRWLERAIAQGDSELEAIEAPEPRDTFL